jgi:hypothetical protein
MNLCIVILRQAGSASGIIPAIEDMLETSPETKVSIIAFHHAFLTCNEVAKNKLHIQLVKSEEEAKKIFNYEIHKDCKKLLITGTSHEAIADTYYWQKAKEYNVESIAYLDQWSNISDRFIDSSYQNWPDTLIVINSDEKKLLQSIAPPSVNIEIVKSPALIRIKHEVQLLWSSGIKIELGRFIFATEPVESELNYKKINGFIDLDCFDLLLSIVRKYHKNCLIILRLHPRDTKMRWLNKIPNDIHIEWDTDTRAMSLAKAERVFGMRSFFLLEALQVNSKVVSLQPNKRTLCPLTDGKMLVCRKLEDYFVL